MKHVLLSALFVLPLFHAAHMFFCLPHHRSPRHNRPKSATRGSRSERYHRSTVASACRCRSTSPDRVVGRITRLGLEDDYEYYDDEPKPPFVVRHVSRPKGSLFSESADQMEMKCQLRSCVICVIIDQKLLLMPNL